METITTFMKNKKTQILQTFIVFSFILFAVLSTPGQPKASEYPSDTNIYSETFTIEGYEYEVTFPDKIYKGENLPVTIIGHDSVPGSAGLTEFEYYESLDDTSYTNVSIVPINFQPLKEGSIEVESKADHLSEGTYTFQFNEVDFYDGSDNHQKDFFIYEEIEIVEKDTTAPSLTGDGVYFSDVENPATLDDIKDTLSATDETDGDLTNDIVNVDDDYSANNTTLGSYDTVWEVSDQAGNTDQMTVTVDVVDITDPTINLNGSSSMTLEVHDSYNEPGAEVSDNYDSTSTLEDSLDIDNTSVDTSEVGTYEVTYDVEDSSGNSANKTRTVTVEDTTAPDISLNGESTMRIEYGGNYNEPGAEVSDNYDAASTLEDSLNIDSSNVNVGELGTYQVEYSLTDSEGNSTTETRTVIVEDTTAPDISADNVTGYNSNPPSLDDVMKDVTADDIYDGDVTSEIEVVNGNVGESVGEYTIELEVTDSEGNTSNESFVVELLDDIAPDFILDSYLISREDADAMTQEEIKDHINSRNQ